MVFNISFKLIWKNLKINQNSSDSFLAQCQRLLLHFLVVHKTKIDLKVNCSFPKRFIYTFLLRNPLKPTFFIRISFQERRPRFQLNLRKCQEQVKARLLRLKNTILVNILCYFRRVVCYGLFLVFLGNFVENVFNAQYYSFLWLLWTKELRVSSKDFTLKTEEVLKIINLKIRKMTAFELFPY